MTVCPFCDASLAIETTAPQEPQERLGRAARMAFGGAAAVAITVAGCGKEPRENIAMPYGAPPNPQDSGQPPPTPDPDANIMMPYGAPPTRAGDGAALTPPTSQPLAVSDSGPPADAGPDADAGKKKTVPTAIPAPTPTRANVNKPYGAPPADGYDVFEV